MVGLYWPVSPELQADLQAFSWRIRGTSDHYFVAWTISHMVMRRMSTRDREMLVQADDDREESKIERPCQFRRGVWRDDALRQQQTKMSSTLRTLNRELTWNTIRDP